MDNNAASALTQLRLCVAQDDATPLADTRKRLPSWIRTPLDATIAELEAHLQAQGVTEGQRAGSSSALKDAYRLGEVLIRDVNRYLKGLPRSVDQSQVLAHYQLQHGLDGGLTHTQIETLLRGFVTLGSAASTPVEMHLRPADVAAATGYLATIDSHKTTATVGIRAAVTEDKNESLDAITALRSRAYHYLCAALDGGVFDPLLAAYGFDPRDHSGQRLVPGEPGA